MMLARVSKRTFVSLSVIFASIFCALMALSPRVEAKVVKTVTACQPVLSIPLTEWREDSRRPRAVAIAIHGLVLHGGVYDTMARDLAAQGILVVAPDLRGYGHWVDQDERSRLKNGSTVDYRKSHADIVALTKYVKTENPTLPVYLIGESLGADMALHVARDCPELLDGLILSAPSVRHRWFVADLMKNAPVGLSMPFKQLDVGQHIQKYFSDDSAIAQAAFSDPLVRKHMSPVELLKTEQEASRCLKYAKRVSSRLPVLVLQGGGDQMLKGKAVSDLLAILPSSDQKLEWFTQRGHLLLETPLIYADTLLVVSSWLNQHVEERLAASHSLVALRDSD